MANINKYPETCEGCGKKRACDDMGLCHECYQLERDLELDSMEGLAELNKRAEVKL